MPTIVCQKTDLEALIGEGLTRQQLEELLGRVKGELKEGAASSDQLKIELADTNRPDLWCVEGIARQLRTGLGKRPRRYLFDRKRQGRNVYQVRVDPGLSKIRPYIGACVAKGVRLTDAVLEQMIQTQEKLSDLFGRKRRAVSIGYYRLSGISFPVDYTMALPDKIRFVPLGFDQAMSAQQILKEHPKGIEYGHLISQSKRLPVLMDSEGQILSMPPVINSRSVGEITTEDQDLLVEATGDDLRMVALVINILAANLQDRGARIEPVQVQYPYPTGWGKRVWMPQTRSLPVELTPEMVQKTLGERISMGESARLLRTFGYRVQSRGKTLIVHSPGYRDDVMHAIDVVEDVAIARGYLNFAPLLPPHFTVGSLTPLEQLSDRVREWMVGFGFQEMISNVLTSRTELLEWMGLEEEVVEVENALSQNHSVLRNWMVPSLLRSEAASSKAFYPHRIFEVGEVALRDDGANLKSRGVLNLAALLAHASASFSETQSFLEMLFYYLDRPYRLVPITHASFIPGRVGQIEVSDSPVGILGEIHPRVLENWAINVPCSLFEMTLDDLL